MFLNLRRIAALAVLALAGCIHMEGGGADSLFAEGWRNESAGASAAAARSYGELTARYPTSPLAAIAAERLAALGARAEPVGGGDGDAAATAAGNAFAADDFVCTLAGIYPRDARWCGLVRHVSPGDLLLEVKSLRLNSFWAWGFGASTCTGGHSIGYFSYGDLIWVPRRCIAPR